MISIQIWLPRALRHTRCPFYARLACFYAVYIRCCRSALGNKRYTDESSCTRIYWETVCLCGYELYYTDHFPQLLPAAAPRGRFSSSGPCFGGSGERDRFFALSQISLYLPPTPGVHTTFRVDSTEPPVKRQVALGLGIVVKFLNLNTGFRFLI